MKFCYFHLMPYAHLPDDFEKRYHSVWVDIPNHLYDPLKGHQLYNTYLDELEYADKLGFDGICVNEHHYNAYGGMPSPNLMAAAMAQRTSQSAIVVLGNSLGLYNPPVRVAEEFAMLDVLSGGRLVAGMPWGAPPTPSSPMVRYPSLCGRSTRSPTTLSLRLGRSGSPSPLMANTTSYVM